MKASNVLINPTKIQENPKNTHDTAKLGDLLETDISQNKRESWCKLNQTEKIARLNDFATSLGKDNQLSPAEVRTLKNYLSAALKRKRLQRVKDVLYDVETAKITSIPMLCFSQTDRRFTLKRSERRSCTTKSLGQGKTRKRVASSTINDKIDNSDCSGM